MLRSSSVLTIAGVLAIAASPTGAVHATESVGLSFDLDRTALASALTPSSDVLFSPLESGQAKIPTPPAHPTEKVLSATTRDTQEVAEVPSDWWTQGSDSPLSVAIGAAEGTRTADGGKTSAYYWHLDPGNQADNFGTFSYQHLPPSQKQVVTQAPTTQAKRAAAAEAQLPEVADQKQLQKLKQFQNELRQQALQQGLTLSELELINGLDLANQSEAASLSKQGYIDRLAQMKRLIPDDQEEQIKEARTWSYWSPERNTWDAPGLGNTYESIRRDQARRMDAIQQSLQQYQAPRPEQQHQVATTPRFNPQQQSLLTDEPSKQELQTFEEFQEEFLSQAKIEQPQLQANATTPQFGEPRQTEIPELATSPPTAQSPTLDFGALQHDASLYRQAATAEREQRANDIIFYDAEATPLTTSSWI